MINPDKTSSFKIMEKFLKYLDNKNKQSQYEICDCLEIKHTTNSSSIAKHFLTNSGLDKIFSKLDPVAQSIINALYDDGSLTYSELHKITAQPIKNIEKSTKDLEKLNIIYVLKNRKHLNNKLDKITLFDVVKKELNPISNSILKNLPNAIIKSEINNTKKFSTNKIIQFISNCGYICTLDLLKNHFKESELENFIEIFSEDNSVSVYNYFGEIYATVIILNMRIKKDITNPKLNVNNSFFCLNNVFTAYDVISTYGLYLTQQDKLRKVDKRRIIEKLIPIYNENGEPLDEKVNLDFTLSLLDNISAIFKYKDHYFVDEDVLKNYTSKPYSFYRAIFKKGHSAKDNQHFNSNIAIPDKNEINILKTIFNTEESITFEYFREIFLSILISYNINSLANFNKIISEYNDRIASLVETFIISGIFTIKNGEIILSHIGYRFLFNKEEPESSKNIYINPDHTLLIPQNEVPSKDLFAILNYTDIIKNDVLIEARITSESIVRAHKRGMNVNSFIKILQQNTKNEIPQNLKFLLQDWIDSITEISISFATIMKTSNPDFLDRLERSSKKYVIERLNNNFAIIDRTKLDEIISFSEKDNTLIQLDSEFKESAE